MNTIFKHKILVGAMLCGALFGATSCEDSEGLKVTPEVPYADKTMYEVMTSDPDLTDFIEVSTVPILSSTSRECIPCGPPRTVHSTKNLSWSRLRQATVKTSSTVL